MTGQPLHLVERAAQQLREDGHMTSELLAKAAGRPEPDLLEYAARASAALGAPDSGPAVFGPAAPMPAAFPTATPASPAALPAGLPAGLPVALDGAALKQAGMIDWAAARNRLSEEFRIIQGQVLQVMATATVKEPALANLVMLTSARPGEGKTFSALNLAGSLANSSHQAVILVDVDSVRHSLSSRLGLGKAPGLLNLAADPTLDPAALLNSTSLPNLRVLPIGQGMQRDASGGSKPVFTVLDRLGRRFPGCIVVLDTPPCLSSSEPSTLAPLVGQVIMLVEAQQTQRAELEAALDLVESCPSVVLLLNKVQMTGSDTFGAYGY